MKVNEIKELKTIEKIVQIEYIAEDGKVFISEDECIKYEKSALFTISKELKRLNDLKCGISEYDIYNMCNDECIVEIFNAETEKDLDNIRRYVYLKIASLHKQVYEKDIELDNITAGHEIIIHWNYDEDGAWAIGDGSINAFCNYIRDNLLDLIVFKNDNVNE